LKSNKKEIPMKNSTIILLAFVLFSAFLVSCEKLDSLDDPKDLKIDKTATYPMNGEWWVTYKLDDGTGALVDAGIVFGIGELGHLKVLSYNTVENVSTKMWITDVDQLDYDASGNFWSYRVVTNLSLKDKSFSVDTASNAAYTSDGDPYNIKVTIKNGTVILNGGRSRSGDVTDSIAYEAEFSDDPGTIYHVSGHRRTGFFEDEY
jgi:hypothetical protein